MEKKSDSPDEDKSLADSKAPLPVLIDFFQKHPLIPPKTFLGDVAFDTLEIYKSLFSEIGFEKAFIPLRVKLSMEDNGYTTNENGVPCCPHDSSFTMKREGHKSHLKGKISTMKFVYPKMKWDTIKQIKQNAVYAIVTIPAQHLPEEECFTFIPKRIFVPIPKWNEVQQNGKKHIKSV